MFSISRNTSSIVSRTAALAILLSAAAFAPQAFARESGGGGGGGAGGGGGGEAAGSSDFRPSAIGRFSPINERQPRGRIRRDTAGSCIGNKISCGMLGR